MASLARVSRLGRTSSASMLREQSSTNRMSSPSACISSEVSPHCGRASARPTAATASTSRACLSARRAGLCERSKSASRSAARRTARFAVGAPRRRSGATAPPTAGPRPASQSQRGSAKWGWVKSIVKSRSDVRSPTESKSEVRKLPPPAQFWITGLVFFGFRLRFRFLHGTLRYRVLASTSSSASKRERRQQRPLEQRRVGREAAQLDLGFLQLVNLVVDALQLAAVGGAVEFAAGQRGHLAEHRVIRRLQGMVGMTLPVGSSLQLARGRIERGQLARLLDADADGVNLRAQRGGELRGGQRDQSRPCCCRRRSAG